MTFCPFFSSFNTFIYEEKIRMKQEARPTYCPGQLGYWFIHSNINVYRKKQFSVLFSFNTNNYPLPIKVVCTVGTLMEIHGHDGSVIFFTGIVFVSMTCPQVIRIICMRSSKSHVKHLFCTSLNMHNFPPLIHWRIFWTELWIQPTHSNCWLWKQLRAWAKKRLM